jgi:hypothetical protein
MTRLEKLIESDEEEGVDMSPTFNHTLVDNFQSMLPGLSNNAQKMKE